MSYVKVVNVPTTLDLRFSRARAAKQGLNRKQRGAEFFSSPGKWRSDSCLHATRIYVTFSCLTEEVIFTEKLLQIKKCSQTTPWAMKILILLLNPHKT